MATSAQIRVELSRYNTFREQINTLTSKVLDSNTKLTSAANKINEGFQINSESGDQGVLKTKNNKVKESYDTLVNYTLPAINRKIEKLKADLKAAEEAESQAAASLERI